MLIGIFSVQFGAGIAKSMFDEVSADHVVWLRLASCALVLTAMARPALRGRSRPTGWSCSASARRSG